MSEPKEGGWDRGKRAKGSHNSAQTAEQRYRKYLDRISAEWPQSGTIAQKTVRLIRRAVSDFPKSAKLWCVLGDAVQIRKAPRKEDLNVALGCYTKAILTDPKCAEAYESLGYLFDVYADDFVAAELAFRRAIELRAGRDSFVGLARVLAETNRGRDALRLLLKCKYRSHSAVRELMREIRSGIWAHASAASDTDSGSVAASLRDDARKR